MANPNAKAKPSNARTQAEEYLANPRFHKKVTVVQGGDRGDVVVSYAEYGFHGANGSPAQNAAAVTVPTVLFLPGMFASRYLGVGMHIFAVKHGVRVLVPDRFGFGKTEDVPVQHRIKEWVALMPAFLQALRIEHVALMSHSSGTIYNMNLLWHCRQILHPERPLVCFLAPFVDGGCSKAPLILALQALPSMSFGYWNRLASFFSLRASGTIEASSGVFSRLTRALGLSGRAKGEREQSEWDRNATVIERDYGLDFTTQAELDKLTIKGMFSEETVGANNEAINCLKKGPKGSWGEAEDMNALVGRIAKRERETENRPDNSGKLGVRIYFSGSDVMTGRRGQQYFEACWRGKEGEYDDCLDVWVMTVEDSDHDSVVKRVEVLSSFFDMVAETSDTSELSKGL